MSHSSYFVSFFQFNLGVKDAVEVLSETKKALVEVNPLSAHMINVEISLRTSDGDTMMLEVWTSRLDPLQCQPVKVWTT